MRCRWINPTIIDTIPARVLHEAMLLLAPRVRVQLALMIMVSGQAALGLSTCLWVLFGEVAAAAPAVQAVPIMTASESADSVASSIPDATVGGDFELQTLDGEPFRLSDLSGQVVLLFFGYTNCPDVCPVTLAQLKRVRALLGEGGKRVAFLFVSIDPERDTPEVIKAYLAHFDQGDHPAHTIGLRGARSQINRVMQTFHISVKRVPSESSEAGGYSIDHSASLYVVAPDGRLASIIPYGLPPEHIVGVVRGVLMEAEPEASKLNHVQGATAPESARILDIDYQFEDMEGKRHRIADLQGVAVVLNVWATWCEPCRRELPSLNRASRRLDDSDLRFVALNWGDERESIAAFLLDHPIDFPVWLDSLSAQDSEVTSANAAGLVLRGLPTTLLLDRRGKPVATLTGPRQWDSQEMLALLRGLP